MFLVKKWGQFVTTNQIPKTLNAILDFRLTHLFIYGLKTNNVWQFAFLKVIHSFCGIRSIINMKRFLFFIGCILFFNLASYSNAPKTRGSIEYRLSMPKPQNHYFEVEILLTDFNEEYVDFKLPRPAPRARWDAAGAEETTTPREVAEAALAQLEPDA